MNFLNRSIVLMGLLFSFHSMAETCALTLQEFTPRSSCREIIKKYAPVEAEDWQSCFIKAINLAHKTGYQRERRLEASEHRQCQQVGTINPLQLVGWTFNDSILPLMDTKGIVNTQTLEHVFKPETGTQVFDEGGGKLF